MKLFPRLLIVILLLIPFFSSAQTPSTLPFTGSKYQMDGTKGWYHADSGFVFPYRNAKLSPAGIQFNLPGRAWFDRYGDHNFYGYDGTIECQFLTTKDSNYIKLFSGSGSGNTSAGDSIKITYDSIRLLNIALDALTGVVSGKQNALGYTPENVANKVNSLTSPNSTTYPTSGAVSSALAGKQDAGTYLVPGDTANKWVPIGDSTDATGYATNYKDDTGKARITTQVIDSNMTHWIAIMSKMGYTDTAAMLNNYLAAILGRVKYSDTSAMLANYLALILASVKYSDTTGMLANYLSAILLRVKYTDTLAMLSGYAGLNRTNTFTATQNTFQNIRVNQIKVKGTAVNSSNQYRTTINGDGHVLLTDTTGNLKIDLNPVNGTMNINWGRNSAVYNIGNSVPYITVSNGPSTGGIRPNYFSIQDSATGNLYVVVPVYGYGTTADSLRGVGGYFLMSKDTGRASPYGYKLVTVGQLDSTLAHFSGGGGSGTVTTVTVNPATGTGVNASVSNPTTTPIIAISNDTVILATRNRVQKAIDSLNAQNFLITETDPVFAASDAFGITSTDKTHWTQAYDKYLVSGSYAAGTITFTTRDGSTWTVTGLNVGTVTSVSSGNLAPIFTSTVTTSTTTPAIAYTLSNAAAYTVLCNTTNASAAPVYSKVDAANMMFGILGIANGGTGTTTTTSVNGTPVPYGVNTIVPNSNLTGPITSIGNATSIGSQTGTGNTFAMSASPTFTGTPVAPTQAFGTNTTAIATTEFVQAALNSAVTKPECDYGTTGALPAYTYSNGSSGVGATITGLSLGLLTTDGISPAVGKYLLVKNETSGNAPYNGIYTVTTNAAGALFVLTRRSDFNSTNNIAVGDEVFIASGNTLASTTWEMNNNATITVGTTNITFAQVGGPGYITASSPLSFSGTALSIGNLPTSIFNSGTSASATTVWAGDGSWKTFVSSVAGLTGAITYSVGTTGTAPNFGSAGTVVTLNIPAASASTVTAGTVSKAQYDQFNVAQVPARFVGLGGSVISSTATGQLIVPYAMTVTNWYILSDVSGSIVIEIKHAGTSIIGGSGNKPTLTSASAANAAVSSWTTTSLTQGEELTYSISGSPTTVTNVQVILIGTKN